MTNDTLTELYRWAQNHLGQPIMLGYLLQKVNGQTPGTLLLLLRQPDSLKPNAEIQIDYTPDRVLNYHGSFNFLPFTTNSPRPELLRSSFGSQPELIQWLKTGQKRIQFSVNNEE